ncbi:hypothetical protein WR25_05332 [Diploscapter pachys]|uniref:Uncharacterized protein n=1 Tax=Diploscapter pachys TaxID=2018661 RepID=A0A2A2M142_9BILA|nr:hypothetical protein WR25_05332 [Diploscapter pachys]
MQHWKREGRYGQAQRGYRLQRQVGSQQELEKTPRAWSRGKRKEMTTKAAVEGSGKQIIRYAWELAASRSDGRGRKHAIKEILL